MFSDIIQEERYVNYNLALLLNTIGFKGECSAYYTYDNPELVKSYNIPADAVPAPSLFMVYMWALNISNIKIEPKHIYNSVYGDAEDNDSGEYILVLNDEIITDGGEILRFNSYADAFEYGIIDICSTIKEDIIDYYNNHKEELLSSILKQENLSQSMIDAINILNSDGDNSGYTDTLNVCTTTANPEVSENEDGRKIIKI